ncbi:MAG: hypothetical protein AB7I19_19005 [Planctomycetota bacterium]
MAKPRPQPNRGPTDLAATIRERLAAGRSKSALEAAKELHKSSPSASSEGLLAEAYAARIAELSSNGHHKEAEEVLNVARARFPAEAARWAAAAKGAALHRGDLTDVLRHWIAGGAERESAGEELRRHLIDPAAILRVDPTVLPTADPLRAECHAILDAFEQAAKGTLEDSAREALRQVARRSPLMPWRAFVLALDAFHAGDDVRCREQLSRIADDDAVARGRDTLRLALLDPAPHDDAVTLRTVRRLVGDAIDAVGPTRKLHSLQPDDPEWDAALIDTLLALRPLGGRPVIRLLRWLTSTTPVDDLEDIAEAAGVGKNWFGKEWPRVLALLSDHAIESTIDMCRWIRDVALRLVDRDPRVPAVAIDFVLERVDALESNVDAALGEDTWQRWRSRVDTHLTLGARHEFSADIHRRVMISVLFMLEEIAASLAKKVPQRLETDDPILKLAAIAVTLQGTPKRFAGLTRIAEDESTKTREAAVRWWIDQFSEDLDAWLKLGEIQLESGDLRGFQDSLRRAGEIAPLDQHVQHSRFSAAMAALAIAWRAGDREEAHAQLIAVEGLPRSRQPMVVEFLGTVRTMLEAPRGFAAADDWKNRADLAAVRWALEGKRPAVIGQDRKEDLAFLARVARLAEATGRALTKLPSGLDPSTEFEAADLPTDPADLLAICRVGKSVARGRRLAHLSAWCGARQDGPNLPYFLVELATFLTSNVKRRFQCRALAKHFGKGSGDTALRAILDDIDLPSHLEKLTPPEAARILSDLRADWAPPAPKATKRRTIRPRQLEFDFDESDAHDKNEENASS